MTDLEKLKQEWEKELPDWVKQKVEQETKKTCEGKAGCKACQIKRRVK